MSTVSNTLNDVKTYANNIFGALGDNTFGTVQQLLQQGFTQQANYVKAQTGAMQQIADASNTANAQFQLQVRQRPDPRRADGEPDRMHGTRRRRQHDFRRRAGLRRRLDDRQHPRCPRPGAAGHAVLLRPGPGRRLDGPGTSRLLLRPEGRRRRPLRGREPDPGRRHRILDLLPRRDLRQPAGDQRRQGLRDQPDRARRARRAARRPAAVDHRPERRRAPPQLRRAHVARPEHRRSADRHADAGRADHPAAAAIPDQHGPAGAGQRGSPGSRRCRSRPSAASATSTGPPRCKRSRPPPWSARSRSNSR